MRPTSRHVKLGLLALLTGVAAVTAVLYLGLSRKPTDVYHTYFDESVQGLDEGAVVKYRGVRIGKVASIRVAPDRRLVDVGLAIDRRLARELRLRDNAQQLRAQLVIFGITGVKLIDLDFADENTPPPPPLSFWPSPLYIPSRPSLLGSVQDDLVAFVHRMPRLADQAVAALQSLQQFVGDGRSVIADTRATIAAIDRMVTGARGTHIARALTSTLGTIDAFGQQATEASTEIQRAARDVRDAARSMRDFVDALEREPDMLLKGRARSRR